MVVVELTSYGNRKTIKKIKVKVELNGLLLRSLVH